MADEDPIVAEARRLCEIGGGWHAVPSDGCLRCVAIATALRAARAEEREKRDAQWLATIVKANDLCYSDPVNMKDAGRLVADLVADSREADDNERKARAEGEKVWRYDLWAGHGCIGLYGDDGEMQCSECQIDFKRATPLEIAHGLARAKEKQRAEGRRKGLEAAAENFEAQAEEYDDQSEDDALGFHLRTIAGRLRAMAEEG